MWWAETSAYIAAAESKLDPQMAQVASIGRRHRASPQAENAIARATSSAPIATSARGDAPRANTSVVTIATAPAVKSRCRRERSVSPSRRRGNQKVAFSRSRKYPSETANA